MRQVFESGAASVPPPTSYEVRPRDGRVRVRYDLLAVAIAGAIGLIVGFLLGSGVGG